MKLSGENRINASPEEVWRALNDPAILKQAIPGCDTLEKVSDTEFKATVTTKIGPVQAKFTGEVQLTDLDPPNGYTISGKGSGGVAGNARGGAKVKLVPDGNGTKASHRSVGGGAWIASPPLLFRRRQALIETMRSIGTRARIARSSGTFTSPVMSRSASHSFGSVIIFM